METVPSSAVEDGILLARLMKGIERYRNVRGVIIKLLDKVIVTSTLITFTYLAQ